jgi:hypothetical protein
LGSHLQTDIYLLRIRICQFRAHNCAKVFRDGKMFIYNILSQVDMDFFEALLQRAACSVTAAAEACRAWEDDGDAGDVADTALAADEATTEAVEAIAGIDPALAIDMYPESRVGRLVLAARLLVLAGTDEGGTSRELEMAAQVLGLAAEA